MSIEDNVVVCSGWTTLNQRNATKNPLRQP